MLATYQKHRLQFRFVAGTSRGTMTERDTYFIYLQENNQTGTGEISPLSGLSLDFIPHIEEIICDTCKRIEVHKPTSIEQVFKLIPACLPAVRFGFETAFLDLMNGGKKLIYKNDFSLQEHAIPINGLVWMGDFEFMSKQLEEKLRAGFDCIKLKIGALDFEKEVELLKKIRSRFSAQEITIRVDANGAFSVAEVLQKLDSLSKYDIHSIEQPIATHQWEAMRNLCEQSPIPIALDEELIPHTSTQAKETLLQYIKPQFIILKPTLLGGLQATDEWIQLATKQHIGWWITSALEANIGLNAISQFTANYRPHLPQGLGTGQLYHNNITSPLTIQQGKLFYAQEATWQDM